MAKKKGNPLSGKFRDPPQEGNASVPEQAEQDTDQVKLTDTTGPEQSEQVNVTAEPTEAPADPAPTDAPAPEQVDQGNAPDQPAEAPAEPMAVGMPTQGEENFEVSENVIPPSAKEDEPEPVTTVNVSDIHLLEGYSYSVQDDKDMWALVESIKQNGVLEPVTVANRPAGGYEMIYGHRRLRACQLAGIQTIPTIIVRNFNRDEIITVNPPSVHEKAPVKPTDAPAPEQADQGEAPGEPSEAPADPAPADTPAPEQADQGEAAGRSPEAPADPEAADTPAPEQSDQGEAADEPSEAPADPEAADTPAPEQADQGEAPGGPPEAPADPVAADEPTPQHLEARFVKLADIVSLPGTYVKDTPREDYTELLDSIKAHGLEKPIIDRKSVV